MPPQLPEAVLKRIIEEQQRSLGQQQQRQTPKAGGACDLMLIGWFCFL
jgi:hypothetical protein